jgi:predicted O-methyltransferase YrrM
MIIPSPARRALLQLAALQLPFALPATAWGTKVFQFWTFLSMLLLRSTCSRLLEIGSGRSTITLAEYASFRNARLASLETSRLWFNKARVELRCLGLSESPVHLVDWAPDGAWYDLEQFRSIVGAIGGFDFAFIDGPNREDGGSVGIRDTETALSEIRATIADAEVVVVDDVHRRHILASLDSMLEDAARYEKFFYDYSIGKAHPNTLCICVRKVSTARAAVEPIREALDLRLYEALDLRACPEP